MNFSKIESVKISDILLNQRNVRSNLKSPNSLLGIQELADNIKVNGLLQPILLRGIFGYPPYDVIVGQRRFLAHQIIGEQTIEAIFSGAIDDIHALLLSISENMC